MVSCLGVVANYAECRSLFQITHSRRKNNVFVIIKKWNGVVYNVSEDSEHPKMCSEVIENKLSKLEF